jgi:D-tyrosyl-tRNA(Tyr) deacylase
MRALIQRVKESSVTIDGKMHSQIGKGLLILLGVEEADNEDDVAWLSGKVVNLRIMDDENGVMNLSVKETGGDLLVVSQFTLHASTKKGNRPSYSKAAKPEAAILLYEKFLKRMALDLGREIFSGVFQAMMDVQLVNDGPVTLLIDSKARE